MKDNILNFLDEILSVLTFTALSFVMWTIINEVPAIIPELPKEEYSTNA